MQISQQKLTADDSSVGEGQDLNLHSVKQSPSCRIVRTDIETWQQGSSATDEINPGAYIVDSLLP